MFLREYEVLQLLRKVWLDIVIRKVKCKLDEKGHKKTRIAHYKIFQFHLPIYSLLLFLGVYFFGQAALDVLVVLLT